MISFTVYGVAQSKGSTKAFMSKGMKFPIITDSNRNAKSWAQLVAQGASAALDHTEGAEIFDGPVRLTVAFYLPRPGKFRKPKWITREPAHITKPDMDKLLRSINDALSKVLYLDDAQIVEVIATKRYAPAAEPPRVTIAIEATSGAPLPLLEARP